MTCQVSTLFDIQVDGIVRVDGLERVTRQTEFGLFDSPKAVYYKSALKALTLAHKVALSFPHQLLKYQILIIEE